MRNFVLMIDLDGTLIRGDKGNLSKSVSRVLSPIANAGRLVINSGRHPFGVQYALGAELPFVPTIALNGAALYMDNWLEPKESFSFSTHTVDSIISAPATQDVTLSIYTADEWWVTRLDSYVCNEARMTGMTPRRLYDAHLPKNVLKMTAMGEEDLLKDLSKYLMQCGLATSVRSNRCYREITPPGRNKTNLIPALLKSLGFTRDTVDIHFLGDSYNDIECADYSDAAYTFSSAPNELSNFAKRIFEVRTDEQLTSKMGSGLQDCKFALNFCNSRGWTNRSNDH